MHKQQTKKQSDGQPDDWLYLIFGPMLRLRTKVTDDEIDMVARDHANAFAEALYSGDETKATRLAQVQAANVRVTYAARFAHAIWERTNTKLIEIQDERRRWIEKEVRQTIILAAQSADPELYWRIKQRELLAKGLSVAESQELKKRADEAIRKDPANKA